MSFCSAGCIAYRLSIPCTDPVSIHHIPPRVPSAFLIAYSTPWASQVVFEVHNMQNDAMHSSVKPAQISSHPRWFTHEKFGTLATANNSWPWLVFAKSHFYCTSYSLRLLFAKQVCLQESPACFALSYLFIANLRNTRFSFLDWELVWLIPHFYTLVICAWAQAKWTQLYIWTGWWLLNKPSDCLSHWRVTFMDGFHLVSLQLIGPWLPVFSGRMISRLLEVLRGFLALFYASLLRSRTFFLTKVRNIRWIHILCNLVGKHVRNLKLYAGSDFAVLQTSILFYFFQEIISEV